jgi:glucosamine 6-phosphate synthetase-like amidotransferase/phosphosugar isomerase protein
MCGIFGIIRYGDKPVPILQVNSVKLLMSELLLTAEMRGKDASGVALLNGNGIRVYKAPLNATRLMQTQGYADLKDALTCDFHAVIGHARAQTKGTYKNNHNNHPIIADKIVGVHNGMIANDDSLFAQYSGKIIRAAQVDSEIIFRLLNHFLSNPEISLIKASQSISEMLMGSYACAFLDSNRSKFVTLIRHWNPIDVIVVPAAHLIIFASVGFMAKRALGKTSFTMFSIEEKEIPNNMGAKISIETGEIELFHLKECRSFMSHSVGAALLPPPKNINQPNEEGVVSDSIFTDNSLCKFIRRIMRRD